jgi:inositol hexakisphosphate/diphosphoinositol-pentakisphosphate kinase
MDDHNKINSHWRHVRSRFYFTSASHMYTLLNVLKHVMKKLNHLEDRGGQDLISKMDESLRLDFMSGIYFRVFENLDLE